MIIGQEKPSLSDLAHHGVKGQKWGVHRIADHHNQKVAARLESKIATQRRLRTGQTKGKAEVVRRKVGVATNFGSNKLYKSNRDASIKSLNYKHQLVMKKLNTPDADRHFSNDKKAKIALGGLVAARVLYVAGALAVTSLTANKLAANAAAAKGPLSISGAAQALKYAKKSKGAFKITTLG